MFFAQCLVKLGGRFVKLNGASNKLFVANLSIVVCLFNFLMPSVRLTMLFTRRLVFGRTLIFVAKYIPGRRRLPLGSGRRSQGKHIDFSIRNLFAFFAFLLCRFLVFPGLALRLRLRGQFKRRGRGAAGSTNLTNQTRIGRPVVPFGFCFFQFINSTLNRCRIFNINPFCLGNLWSFGCTGNGVQSILNLSLFLGGNLCHLFSFFDRAVVKAKHVEGRIVFARQCLNGLNHVRCSVS